MQSLESKYLVKEQIKTRISGKVVHALTNILAASLEKDLPEFRKFINQPLATHTQIRRFSKVIYFFIPPLRKLSSFFIMNPEQRIGCGYSQDVFLETDRMVNKYLQRSYGKPRETLELLVEHYNNIFKQIQDYYGGVEGLVIPQNVTIKQTPFAKVKAVCIQQKFNDGFCLFDETNKIKLLNTINNNSELRQKFELLLSLLENSRVANYPVLDVCGNKNIIWNDSGPVLLDSAGLYLYNTVSSNRRKSIDVKINYLKEILESANQ